MAGGRPRTEGLLIVSEVALAAVLLVGSGLLLRSFVNLNEVTPGHRTEGVVSFRVTLTVLAGPLGLVSLALAVIGLYGVTAYAVSQRTREIGIRVALGATSRSVVGLFATRVVLLAGAGCVVGLAVSMAVSGLLSSLLFEIPARDPATYLTAAAVLLLSATGAAILPTARASRMDPIHPLRKDR
jgi:ABC-type antimicrobial peptide transport system permease subunit